MADEPTAGQGGSEEQAAAAAGAGGAATEPTGPLLFDDFENGSADNWATTTLGDWSVVSSGGSQVYKQGTKGADLRLASAGEKTWQNVSIEAKVKIISFGGSSSGDFVGVCARFGDLDNYYYAALRADGKAALKAHLQGSDSPLGAAADVGITTNVWYALRLDVKGSELSFWLDGELLQTATDASLSTGAIAIGENNATMMFDDIKVTAL